MDNFINYDTLLYEEVLGIYNLDEAIDSEMSMVLYELKNVRRFMNVQDIKDFTSNAHGDIRLLKEAVKVYGRKHTINVEVTYDWFENGKTINLGKACEDTVRLFMQRAQKDIAGNYSYRGEKEKPVDSGTYNTKYGGKHGAQTALDSLRKIAPIIHKWSR